MEELIFKLNKIRPLSAGLEARLRRVLRQHLFQKGDFILRIGEVAGDILYIRSGPGEELLCEGQKGTVELFYERRRYLRVDA